MPHTTKNAAHQPKLKDEVEARDAGSQSVFGQLGTVVRENPKTAIAAGAALAAGAAAATVIGTRRRSGTTNGRSRVKTKA